jgi:hypothetical protein
MTDLAPCLKILDSNLGHSGESGTSLRKQTFLASHKVASYELPLLVVRAQVVADNAVNARTFRFGADGTPNVGPFTQQSDIDFN